MLTCCSELFSVGSDAPNLKASYGNMYYPGSQDHFPLPLLCISCSHRNALSEYIYIVSAFLHRPSRFRFSEGRDGVVLERLDFHKMTLLSCLAAQAGPCLKLLLPLLPQFWGFSGTHESWAMGDVLRASVSVSVTDSDFDGGC